MSHFTLIILFFVLLTQLLIVYSCHRLKIEGLNEDIAWINGEFILEPTLIANGRPVYIEDIAIPEPKVNENGEIIEEEEEIHEKRIIYHYSHGIMDDLSEEDRYNFNYHGRWMIGNDILSSSGWAFISSWSIDPIIDTIFSLSTSDFSHIKDIALDDVLNQDIRSSNKGIEKIYRKQTLWRLWLNDEWVIRDDFIITCIDDDDDDWLFITTNDYFGNINENNSNWLNYQMIHGFYYRLNHNIWKLVEQNIYLYCNINDNATSITTLINTTDNNNTYQVINKLEKECLIYEYHGYTDDNGMPFEGMHTVKNKLLNISLELNLNDYKNQDKLPWENKNINHNFIYTNKHHENKELSQKVNIIIINRSYATPGSELEIVKNRKLTIYDAYREYYYRLKSKSIQFKSPGFDVIYKTLNNGLQFHMLGLGTGGLLPDDNKTYEILNNAYQIGYRLIDTSAAYWSEIPIGMLISQEKKVNRDELFIATKIWPTELGFLETYQEVFKSMIKMNLNYIDLYMIHWAFCYDTFIWMDCTHATKKPWSQTYHMMEKLYAEGRLLNIGVSNFDFKLMKELEENIQLSLLPQVLQNYFDIAHQDWELVQIVNEMGIIYQGYATYRGISEAESRIENEPIYMQWKELLKEIVLNKQEEEEEEEEEEGDADNKITESQILLRWLLDNNVAVLPRSANKTHLQENFNLWNFEITDEENEILMTKANEGLKEEL